jgi:hypothetical protein
LGIEDLEAAGNGSDMSIVLVSQLPSGWQLVTRAKVAILDLRTDSVGDAKAKVAVHVQASGSG